MNLDRLEVLGMIGFIKHVIPDSEETGKNCLFIRIEGDKVICTGGGEHAAKKVVLIRHQDMEEGSKKKVPENFMIPKGTLEAFETLLLKHKKKCKKLAKNDPSHLYIDITNDELESHGVVLKYPQPEYQFKDLEPLFENNKAPVEKLFLYSGDVSNVMAGFKKSKQVETIFSGEDCGPIHFIQKDTDYQAILIPPPEEDEKPPMMGDNEDDDE